MRLQSMPNRTSIANFNRHKAKHAGSPQNLRVSSNPGHLLTAPRFELVLLSHTPERSGIRGTPERHTRILELNGLVVCLEDQFTHHGGVVSESIKMKLSASDEHHFRAAQGWLELGLPADALEELERMESSAQEDPGVVALRMGAFYGTAAWDKCLDAAMKLIQADPNCAGAYIDASVALYRLGRTQEAWDLSLPVVEKFSENWVIPYNLACYAAQLGNKQDALKMFDLALNRGDRAEIKGQAFNDPDLKPIWQDIADD